MVTKADVRKGRLTKAQQREMRRRFASWDNDKNPPNAENAAAAAASAPQPRGGASVVREQVDAFGPYQDNPELTAQCNKASGTLKRSRATATSDADVTPDAKKERKTARR
jgi:hypothetical protein